MRELINSKIEWIGETPFNWKIGKILQFFHEGNEKNTGTRNQNLLSLSYGRIIRKDINTSGGLLPASFSTYNIVDKGDIIIRPTDLQNDKVSLRTGLVTEKGIITSAYIDMKPNEGVNSNFFHKLLHSYDICKVFYNMGSGVRQGIGFVDISKLIVFVPPLEEQKKIADFLDDKCAQIDEITKDLEGKINKLEEIKKSVIFESVTKGLDKSAEMKDSGYAWLGEIPAHWKIIRISALYSVRNIKVSDKQYPPLSVTKQGILPQLESVAKTNDNDNRKLVKIGDFVINSRSDRRGSCGISNYEGSVSLINTVLASRNKGFNKYFDWLFHSAEFSDEFYKWGHGIVDDLWTTTWQDMKKISVALPPLEEQKKIADFLDDKCAQIDEITKATREEIETLKQYKQSLIYEYVTGKKEVPNE